MGVSSSSPVVIIMSTNINMEVFSMCFLLCLGVSSSVKPIRNSRPLEPEDFERGKSLDIKTDHLDLYPGTGGPRSPPAHLRTSHNQTNLVNWQIWHRGLIPYWLDPQFSEIDRESIAIAIAYIEDETCLRFEPDTDDSTPRMDIIAEDLGGSCFTVWESRVTDRREDTYAEVHLSPSSSCTVPRTIVHELMHGIAFYHTHTREDRNKTVEIIEKNIKPSQSDQFEYCGGCCCDTWGLNYDCSSVMHYARDQMSRNGKDTIKSLSEDCNIPYFSEWNYHEPIMSNT